MERYTYDSYHNVTSAVSSNGVTTEFSYDQWGNNTRVTVKNGATTSTVTAAYTADGNLLSTVTDALGKTTSYGCHPQRLLT